VCADDINLKIKTLYTVKKNVENLLQARKEFDLEVNVDKIKYMFCGKVQIYGNRSNK